MKMKRGRPNYQKLKVNNLENMAEFRDSDGSDLRISFWSSGEAIITVDGKAVELTNRTAHEVRDFFNRRYPNATAVQGD